MMMKNYLGSGSSLVSLSERFLFWMEKGSLVSFSVGDWSIQWRMRLSADGRIIAINNEMIMLALDVG